MNRSPIHPIITWLIILSVLAPTAPVATVNATTVNTTTANAKTPPATSFLAQLAAHEPDEIVSIIVQKQGRGYGAETLVQAGGGKITRQLPMINAFVATIPVQVITTLQQSADVRQVSLDAPVQSQNTELANGLNASDDFKRFAYDGSDGSYAWLTDWQEIGEADGADQGDVGVIAFWGGALRGMRLQGSNKGVWRSINLSAALNAQVQISYRRKGFQNPNDYVALQLSTNGLAWTEVARWTGATTDGQIQYETYDISAYRAAQTSLRFVTSAAMGNEARFYVDRISVTFAPSWERSSQEANKLYLPFIGVNDGEARVSGLIGQLTKAERLASLSAAGIGCGNYCINLEQLASTYVKSVRAEQIWNMPPYPRGAGVRVAVVDSGISPHPDLNDALGASRIITHVNFVLNSPIPDDFYGHGTHIAGTIAGAGQSSGGVYMGIAPEAELVDIKVMDDWGRGNTADVLAGLQWIYNNRAAYQIGVVNLSLNSTIPQSYHESPLDAALEVLWFNKIVVVVSAGNGGTQKLYPPANDPFVITVGALDDKDTADPADDTLANFSAYGMTGDGFLKPDLVAPGTHIVAPLSGDDNNLTWAHPENKVAGPYNTKYYQMSGTSMAAAVVSGAVALLLEDDPTLNPDQVKYRLRATTRSIPGSDNCSTGAGVLDIQAAVNGTTTASQNTGVPASRMLWTGTDPVNWSSVNWSSVNWSSVNWSSVNWSSVNWSSVNWSSVNWSSTNTSTTNSSGNCTSALQRLMLVNPETKRDIQPLYNGAVINLDAIGTRGLSIRADTFGSVNSVTFTLDNSYTKTENGAPYTLVGELMGTYFPYIFSNGAHKLKVTTYSSNNSTGAAGAAHEIDFVVASGNRCELEGAVRAQNSNIPMRFQVYNNTTTPLELFWLNTNGQRQSYGTIAPGTMRAQTSYVTHPWLIARESDDACVRLIPDAGYESSVVVDTLFAGTYQLSAAHSNKCLDLASASTADGVAVQQATCNSNASQKWRVELVDKGAYRIISAYSNKALDVNGAYPMNGTKVQQWSYAGTINQKWRIEPAGDGSYWLVAVHSGKVLDVSNSGVSDGTAITQWSNNGGNNQKWRLTVSN